MRNLSYISEISPEAIYLGIASSKNNPCRDILYSNDANQITNDCIQNRVLDRYREYQENIHCLENIVKSNFVKNEQECLKGCYSSETKALEWLYLRLFEIQDQFNKDKCPYCGINSPTTRDHYLPKEIFPEFSVMSYNLIPCCDDCNRLKGEKWKSENGGRLFVHFYFDKVPNDIFMQAQVTVTNKTPLVDISLCPPNGTVNPFYDIVKTHFDELNVLERIEHKVTTYITEIYQKNLNCLEEGLDEFALKRLLNIELRNLEKNHGKNYWKSVVSRGIIACDDFFRKLA